MTNAPGAPAPMQQPQQNLAGIRTRTPINRSVQPSAGQPAAQQPGQGGWMKTGDVARAASAQELERQRVASEERARKRNIPWPFWLPVGAQADIIILDYQLGPCFYEHELQNPTTGKYDIHEPCPKEFDTCPLCPGGGRMGAKDSQYVMKLTVIDMRQYQNREGAIIPHSRRLLTVKAGQHGFFMRLADRLGGNLRGVHLLMTRDQKSTPSIGNPEFLQQHSEEEILQAFGHPPVIEQGKVIKQQNADCYPLNYADAFPRPSGDDLRRRYGGVAPAGSRQQMQDEWGGAAPGSVAQPPQGYQQQGMGIQPAAGNQLPPPAAQPGIQPQAGAGIQPAAQPVMQPAAQPGIQPQAGYQAPQAPLQPYDAAHAAQAQMPQGQPLPQTQAPLQSQMLQPQSQPQPQPQQGGGIQARAQNTGIAHDLDDDIPFE